MKTKRFLANFLLAAPLMMAANAGAQGVINAPAGQAYTIISTAPATAVNAVTYQWYRGSAPISGATGLSYTVPASLAYGDNVMFRRMAKVLECAGTSEAFSNAVTITFTGYITPEGCTLVVSGVCWAAANIDAPFTFASRPDMNTQFYQWNKCTTPYSTNDPLSPAWDNTANTSETWTCNPCPVGWRMPTLAECQQLANSGSTWVEANTRGAAVPGRFYGYNSATCTLPSNMSGCVFFPASGNRGTPSGTIYNRGAFGLSWSNTQQSTTNGYNILFTNSSSSASSSGNKADGFPIRCVQ